jgi:predicted O-linked N-acetylglucosamine transferase (SPINDLY family)
MDAVSFQETYQTIVSDPSAISLPANFYQDSIELVRHNLENTPLCEDILYKLLVIYPNNADLCYYMACICKSVPNNVHRALYWFDRAFHLYKSSTSAAGHYNLDPIENTLDYMKTLFDNNCIGRIGSLFREYPGILESYPHDARWQLFLGAFYIKTDRYYRAETLYKSLWELFGSMEDSDIFFQILNNQVILAMRMGKAESIRPILEKAPQICRKLIANRSINDKTKQELFCGIMLALDYVYHDPKIRIAVASQVRNFFPKTVSLGSIPRPYNAKPRIGYISADFMEHVVGNFIWPILENHRKFDVFVFMNNSYNKFKNEPHYASKFPENHVYDIEHMSTEDAVRLIQSCGIDILVDLNGFTKLHRLDVFSQRPAPIQISYLGFPNTVGSYAITQYRITDVIADPESSKQWYGERLLRMNRCFLLYRSLHQAAPYLRDTERFPGTIVLGSMNKEAKLSKEVLDTWRRILALAPHTKILIKIDAKWSDATTTTDPIELAGMRNHQKWYCEQLGVDADRIIFAPHCTIDQYFALFDNIDLLLDTYPYSGTTTTCNALYNSVPVVTLRHPDCHAHNVTTSLLHHCGLPELIADSSDQYVDIVVGLANDRTRLERLRAGHVHELFRSMMNPIAFMAEYERVLWEAYREFYTN